MVDRLLCWAADTKSRRSKPAAYTFIRGDDHEESLALPGLERHKGVARDRLRVAAVCEDSVFPVGRRTAKTKRMVPSSGPCRPHRTQNLALTRFLIGFPARKSRDYPSASGGFSPDDPIRVVRRPEIRRRTNLTISTTATGVTEQARTMAQSPGLGEATCKTRRKKGVKAAAA